MVRSLVGADIHRVEVATPSVNSTAPMTASDPSIDTFPPRPWGTVPASYM